MKLARLLCFALMIVAPLAHAWNRPEMARYGSAYSGPEQLRVYVAHNKADTHAVVKIFGINHPLDRHVFWTKVVYSSGRQERVGYVDEKVKEDHLKTVLDIDGSSATLYLPNYRGRERAEIKLSYDRAESQQTNSELLLTDYERQIGAVK